MNIIIIFYILIVYVNYNKFHLLKMCYVISNNNIYNNNIDLPFHRGFPMQAGSLLARRIRDDVNIYIVALKKFLFYLPI